MDISWKGRSMEGSRIWVAEGGR